MGPIGFKELLIILVIALLIFGAKRLKTIGSDLGGAVKGFKKAMDEGDDKESRQLNSPDHRDGQKDADFDSTPAAGKSGTKSNV
jgi:sec-independent protein translocase protein TatA